MNIKNKIASKRLGHTGPEKIKNTPKNVCVVDCDEINNIYDFPKGHTYFLPSKKYKINHVLEHIFSILDTGRFDQDKKIRNIIINK